MDDRTDPGRPRGSAALLWGGSTVVLLGVLLGFGLLFVPPGVFLDDPGLAPMPESLLGGWAVLVGLLMVGSGLRRRRR